MKEQELKGLSTDQLLKRKRFAVFIIGVMIGISAILTALSIWSKNLTNTVFLAGLFVVALPMIIGIKKINEELESRKEDSQ